MNEEVLTHLLVDPFNNVACNADAKYEAILVTEKVDIVNCVTCLQKYLKYVTSEYQEQLKRANARFEEFTGNLERIEKQVAQLEGGPFRRLAAETMTRYDSGPVWTSRPLIHHNREGGLRTAFCGGEVRSGDRFTPFARIINYNCWDCRMKMKYE